MKNVFIAIGGSGTKVAEALVRLLAVGFPTHKDEKGNLTSAGDYLEIWRVDTDKSSGASEDLNNALKDYLQMQSWLSNSGATQALVQKNWAMDIEKEARHLDPVDLPPGTIKNLRGILDSQTIPGGKSSVSLLAPFYDAKDLEVLVDRGFYQKPFIGSAVMSIFAKSLENDSQGVGSIAGLRRFDSTPTNFFLCGSLHGGTGACGVPVIADFLKKRKDQHPGWGWRIGGCMLAPYVTPPDPPFKLESGKSFDETAIPNYVRDFGDHPAFNEMTPGQKAELVRQILLGFYADPNDMEERARQGLAYYCDHGADYFDELYLVGKPNPNKLKTWSNGGKSQRNPLNSAEVVGAIAALNFFARADTGNPNSYVVGSSFNDIPADDMRLAHLPSYKVGDQEIEPEKVFLAAALMNHLIKHQIVWDNVRAGTKEFALCRIYEGKGKSKVETDEEKSCFSDALRIISNSLLHLVRVNEAGAPTGWNARDTLEILKYFASDEKSIEYKEVENNLRDGWFRKAGVNKLGISGVKLTTEEFGKWCPEGDQFTRGEYLRRVWSEIFNRCQTQTEN